MTSKVAWRLVCVCVPWMCVYHQCIAAVPIKELDRLAGNLIFLFPHDPHDHALRLLHSQTCLLVCPVFVSWFAPCLSPGLPHVCLLVYPLLASVPCLSRGLPHVCLSSMFVSYFHTSLKHCLHYTGSTHKDVTKTKTRVAYGNSHLACE